jgi:predicted nuclease of predicted toxin-antitoxin system
MKILLDECIPRRLKFELKNHDPKTVQEMGWTGKKNGELLALADKGFEVFITLDKNLEAQLNVSKFNLKIVGLFDWKQSSCRH